MKKLYIPFIFLLMGYGLMAQVPQTLSFQGVLLDNGGNPITGTKNLTVRIFDVLNGGTAIWTETHLGVELSDEGIYNIFLGSQNPDGFDTLAFSRPYFMELEYSGESLTPRIQLSSSSYILNANLMDLSDGTLSELDVAGNASISGDVTGNSFAGDGSALTSLDGAKITNATITSAKISGQIAVEDGGTGGSTSSAARTNLGLKIGQDVQAYNANLDDLADGTLSANKVENGSYFISSAGTNGQVWNSDGTGAGRWTNQSNINAGQVDGYEGADLDQTILNSSAEVTGVLRIDNGGTGASNAASARTNLGADNASNLITGTVADDRLESRIDRTIFAAADYIIANGGVHVGGTSDPGTDNLIVDGNAAIGGNIDSSHELVVTRNASDDTPAFQIRQEGAGSIGLKFNLNDGTPFTMGLDKDDLAFKMIANGNFINSENGISITKTTLVGIGRLATANKLEVNGNASKTTAGDWAANSDRRIKTNIQDIENSLEILKKLRPVKFKYTQTWREKNPVIEDRFYYNFIAQEYLEVFPESVTGSGEYIDEDSNEILQVDSYSAQIVTIKAVQELIWKVEKLENEKKSLKTELEEVNARLKAIEEVLMLNAGQK